MNKTTLIFVVFCFKINSMCISQLPGTINIQRINGSVTLDGLSNESAWEGINTFKPTMQRPVFGIEPTEETEILLAYDDNYIYVAGRLYDKEPDKILATSYKRDAGNASMEWFGVALDTYNDKENAVAFFTTPTGLRWDATVVDGPQGISNDKNWNTFWDVAVKQNNEGWFAEFKIPFSSIRFQSKDGKVSMGLISWRLIGRKNEWVIFPAIPDNWNKSFYKISRAKEISFDGIKRKNPLYVTPYVLSGREETFKLNNSENAYLKNVYNKLEGGLDIKYSITNNITLDATINTDFSQVEIDDQIISLNRFSIYMPEKRQFFLERSNNFDFTFNRSNKVFYSRRIGINSNRLVRTYGGGRIVGREGKTDIGFLNMQTAALDTFPSENLGVLRLKQNIFNNNSYIGCIGTSKIGTDGSYNVVYGIDGVFQIHGDDYFKIMTAQSQDNTKNENVLSQHSLRYQIELERRSKSGFNYLLGTGYAGKNYNPALGFEAWRNYRLLVTRLEYRWFGKKTSRIYQTYVNIWPYTYINNSTNKFDILNFNLTISTSTKTGYGYKIIGFYSLENINDSVKFLKKIDIPEGHYKYYYFDAKINSPATFPFKSTLDISLGSYYDGRQTSFAIQPVWNLSRYLELDVRYQFDRIEIKKRNQKAESHLFRFKTLIMLNTKLSLAAFIQYSNIEKLSVSNIRFRYNPKEGNDLYIVYNHGFNTGRRLQSLEPPVTDSWNISMKYTHTFIF